MLFVRAQWCRLQPAQRHHPVQPRQPDGAAMAVRALHRSAALLAADTQPVCVRSNLGGNQLNGTIPSFLGSLTGLTALCVPCRSFAASLAAETAHPACVRSDLSYNQLSGTIPSSMGSLTALQQLCVCAALPSLAMLAAELTHPGCACSHLDDNQLSGTIPSSVGSLTAMTWLCVPCSPLQSCSRLSSVIRLACAVTSPTTCSAAPSRGVWAG